MPKTPSSALLALLASAAWLGLAPAEAGAQPGLPARGALESSGGGGSSGPGAGGTSGTGSFGSGGATSGNTASPNMFPDSDSALHWNIQSEPPMPKGTASGKKAAKPIISAGG